MERIKVLVVDDSALMRRLLEQLLSEAPDVEVVATTPDPFVAWEQIKRTRPDVITLDVEMPRMDGITFLTKLMTHYPVPIVMVSSLTQANCETSLRALELGAVDVFAKPEANVLGGITEAADELIDKVRSAARARVRRRSYTTRPPMPRAHRAGLGGGVVRATHQIIAIGASTGGTEAIREVLTAFPPDAPGTVIVQHMPERFTAAFAERLDRLCQIKVSEAKHGDRVLPGHALVAPGGRHLTVVRSGATCTVAIEDSPPVNRHRPSVDVLFSSCARQLGKNVTGVILTGMGDDGAAGLRQMRDAGAHTIAQDEASSVVFGMPRVAIERGGAVEVLPLAEIGPAVTAR
jgi:two-component system, chemotaxis family, protein-glutamate methylesterase/glutaminase